MIAAMISLCVLMTSCGGSSSTGADTAAAGNTAAGTVQEQADSDAAIEDGISGNGVSSEPDFPKELDPSVSYQEGESEVLAGEELSVSVLGYKTNEVYDDMKDSPCFVVDLAIKNKTDRELDVESGICTVNRLGLLQYDLIQIDEKGEPQYWFRIPAGEKIDASLRFSQSELAACGITSVDEIYLTLQDWDRKEYGAFTIYPSGKSAEEIVQAEPFAADEMDILLDNDVITLGVLKDSARTDAVYGVIKGNGKRIKYYVFNKTEQPFFVSIDEMTVNGNPYYYYITHEENGVETEIKSFLKHGEKSDELLECRPGCGSLAFYWLDDKFVNENNINDISELDLKIGVADKNHALFYGAFVWPTNEAAAAGQSDSSQDSDNVQKYKSVEYLAESRDIAETDDFKVTAVSYDPEYINIDERSSDMWGDAFLVHIKIENKTKKEYSYNVSSGTFAVNRLAGFAASGVDECKVAPGETGDLEFYIEASAFTDYHILSVDELRFSLEANSTEYLEAQKAYYENSSDEELSAREDELYNSDHRVKYCTAFPTGKKEEEIVPAVSLDDPMEFDTDLDRTILKQAGVPYSFAFRKGKSGIYNNGLDPWVCNNDPENSLYVELYEVTVDGKIMKQKNSYSDEENEYSYNITHFAIPPLCVIGGDLIGKDLLESNQGLFLNQDVLEYNGLKGKEEIKTDFEIYVEPRTDSYTEQGSWPPGIIVENFSVHTGSGNTDTDQSDTADTGSGNADTGQSDAPEAISFETEDLEGNPVTSSDIFSSGKYTMINLWATWCGPCIKELPELASLSREYEEKGCRIIGICIDGEEEKDVATQILKAVGAEYLNLVSPENLDDILPANVIPTTYFVDSNGVICIDTPIQGADIEAYREIMDMLLSDKE